MIPISQRLERIATQAQPYPDMALTRLAHDLDVAMLERAFERLHPKSARGVDRVRWRTSKEDVETNREPLHGKRVNDTYRPQPVVRRLIPKGGGKFRPLGLPMGYAYCISLLGVLGIAVAALILVDSLNQLTQYSGLAVADQVDLYQTSSSTLE